MFGRGNAAKSTDGIFLCSAELRGSRKTVVRVCLNLIGGAHGLADGYHQHKQCLRKTQVVVFLSNNSQQVLTDYSMHADITINCTF